MFDEFVFLKALTQRPADAKKFSQFFEPQWLQTAALQPILRQVYEFLKDHDTPPSISVLHDIFLKEDKQWYDNKHKQILDQISSAEDELSKVLLNLDRAKDAGMANSMKTMVESVEFETLIDEQDGPEIAHKVEEWLQKFQGKSDDLECSIKKAIDVMVESRAGQIGTTKIPSGIQVFDDWCGYGLRPKQMGLIIAPSGSGKSTVLMIIAYKIAAIAGKRVLFISNELSMDEVAERFLSLMSGHTLDKVIFDPIEAIEGLDRHWDMGLDNKLWLAEVKREISTNDIESMIARYVNLYGWQPEVIVIDYMERMKPTLSGYKRDQTWNWYGGIAQDLVRLNKRYNILTWTAGQVNRGGYNNNTDMSMAHAQGSIRHLQEVDCVIAMRQLPSIKFNDPALVALQFHNLKMRQSKRSDDSAIVEADLGRMLITNRVHSLSEFEDNEDEQDNKKMKTNYKKRNKNDSDS